MVLWTFAVGGSRRRDHVQKSGRSPSIQLQHRDHLIIAQCRKDLPIVALGVHALPHGQRQEIVRRSTKSEALAEELAAGKLLAGGRELADVTLQSTGDKGMVLQQMLDAQWRVAQSLEHHRELVVVVKIQQLEWPHRRLSVFEHDRRERCRANPQPFLIVFVLQISQPTPSLCEATDRPAGTGDHLHVSFASCPLVVGHCVLGRHLVCQHTQQRANVVLPHTAEAVS
mmetsp:Transcript_160243/g.514126  ORF Transcript_160243/g.514126 Transcript_160243/m.514126 type:complete len:227 (-) Transcript_160243:5184-5864(-)